MKALRFILYGVIVLAAVGLLLYYILWEKDLSPSNLFKCLLILASALVGMIGGKKRLSPINRRSVYQKAYGEFLLDAFSDNPKLKNKLYQAIDDYNKNRHAAAISKLEKLKAHCLCTADRYAVTAFLALCSDDLGLLTDAIRYYQDACAMRGNSTLFSNLGLIYQRTGKFDEAEEAYRQSILLDPKNTYALNNLSVLYFRKGEYEESLALSEQVLALDSGMVQALSNAALCCAVTDRKEKYQEYYRRAVSNGYDGRKIKAFLAQMAMEEDASGDKGE